MTTLNEVTTDRPGRVAPNGGGAAGSMQARAPEAGSQPEHSPLVAESVSILDSAMEFLLARLHLEGYRLERHGRTLFLQAAGVVAAGAVAMLGFVLVSVGAAFVLSQLWGSLAAAMLAVGGAELVGGTIVAMWLARRSARRRLQGEPS